MSQFYDQASLVMIPSGYKNGKVYSQKPLSTDGELTFTRASSATRVASNGLIEKVRTNLILQSNTFSNASWGKNSCTVTSGQAGYDGSTNAWLLSSTATAGSSYVSQGYTSSTIVTRSVYAKAGSSNWLAMFTTGNIRAYFDLQNGVIGTVSAGVTAKIESLGNGFYRCSASQSTGDSMFLFVANADNDSNTNTGDNILIQAAQLETGDIATDYIATTSAAVSVGPVSGLPRLDYLGSSCGKLLLEGQRTNLLTYSEQLDNAAWSKVLASSLANDTTSPDGYTNADKIRPNSGVTFSIPASGIYTAGASSYIRSSGLTLTAASYTFSAFVKKGEYDYIQLRAGTSIDTTANGSGVAVNLNNGTTPATSGYSIEDYGDGWYRISHTFTATATTWYLNFWFWNSTSVTANGTDGVYVYGAQLEEGAYPTSYIPTLGAAVTRLVDSAYKTGISSLIGQSEGTLYWEGYVTPAGEWNSLLSVEVLGTQFINLRLNPSNQIELGSGNLSTDIVITGSTPLSSGTYYKIAGAYKSGQNVLYVNGVQIGTSATTFTTPTLTDFRFNVWNVFDEQKRTAQALLFKTRLTNAQLAELTTL